MIRKFSREIAALGLPGGSPPSVLVSERDLAPLPPPAQRYLRFMGVVGRPRDRSFRVHGTGRFRMALDQPWRPMEFLQYDTGPEIARIFHMRMPYLGPIPVQVRDTYVRGKGRMQGRLLDLFTVVDATGPELDIGELVTYLNDVVIFAPSMLLDRRTVWSAVDDHAFDLSLTDGQNVVLARVFVDDRGAATDFSTRDRFYRDPHDPRLGWIRTLWSTPLTDWQEIDGRWLPESGRARWHLDQGEFLYGEFRMRPGAVVFNVAPGS
jgi:hypothetical protein